MRSYEESQKSKKTVASMIERKGDDKQNNKKSVKILENKKEDEPPSPTLGGVSENDILANRKKLAEKIKMKKKTPEKPKSPKVPNPEKAGKKPRKWDLGGNSNDLIDLDRSKDKPEDARSDYTNSNKMVGTMKGGVGDLVVDSDSESSCDDSDEIKQVSTNYTNNKTNGPSKKSAGMMSLFKGLVGSKNLTQDDMKPALEKFKDHLIGKNVASDIAYRLCDSVAAKLEGKVLGTFDTIAATVKHSLTESLVQILSPKRRVDILRDCLEAKKNERPYVMAFCGVNGVGKSTNLAKICFWLIENNYNVLIAACDTFRAGAVEQLRTHTKHLNALHPKDRHGGREMVTLYEKGYGKDAAGIAMEAIRHAKDSRIDVVLVDTAGRMQDNEPLMRALTKLIKV